MSVNENEQAIMKTFSRKAKLQEKAAQKYLQLEDMLLHAGDGGKEDGLSVQFSPAGSPTKTPRSPCKTPRSPGPDSLQRALQGLVVERTLKQPPMPSPKGKGSQANSTQQQQPGYNRRAAPVANQQKAAALTHYLAEMKAHFQEVDKFQLAEESPLPPVKHSSSSALLSPVTQAPATALAEPVPKSPLLFARIPKSSSILAQAPATPGTAKPVSGDAAAFTTVGEMPQPELRTPELASASCGGLSRTETGDHASTGPDASQYASGSDGFEADASEVSASSRHKAMSLGMSRRASVIFTPHAARTSEIPGARTAITGGLTPARRFATELSKVRLDRASLGPLPLHRQPLLNRISSHFALGQGLSRLSLGLSDALHRLGLRGCVPPTPLPAREVIAWADGPAAAAVAADLASPTESQTMARAPLVPHDMNRAASFIGSGAPLTPADKQPIQKLHLRADSSPEAEFLSPEATAVPDSPPSSSRPQLSAGIRRLYAESEEAEESICADLEAHLRLTEVLTPARTRTLEQEDEEEAPESLTPLQQLLRLCQQEAGEVGELPSILALLGQHVDLAAIRKIGEGTFGEAFKAGSVVFKIVPMEGSQCVNGEPQKTAAEILAEVAITLTLSDLRGPEPTESSGDAGPAPAANETSGFVQTYGVGVCRGSYAEALSREWHAWDEIHESENDPVDDFPPDQLFVVFVVADGGVDLEHLDVRSMAEAKSILLQVGMTLAVAEQACEFEHRDLHWGNLLLQRGGPHTARYRLRGVDIEVQTGGMIMTLIDFTLSRLRTVSGDVAFCDLAADPEIFQGPRGDCQADTYRRMRKLMGDSWQEHQPATNCMWLHYLADIMLTHKRFPASAAEKRDFRDFRKRALQYQDCSQLIWDEFFQGLWVAGNTSAP